VGDAAIMASRKIEHLSESSRPRTFQTSKDTVVSIYDSVKQQKLKVCLVCWLNPDLARIGALVV
jgi:hypothetical protein